MTDIAYPLHIDSTGRVAQAGEAAHVAQMIEQLIFTAPGERVNRPEFGAGVMQLVFAPNSPELAAATEFMLQSALQQYLGDLLKPEAVRVRSTDSTLSITVQYILLRNQQRRTNVFTREL